MQLKAGLFYELPDFVSTLNKSFHLEKFLIIEINKECYSRFILKVKSFS